MSNPESKYTKRRWILTIFGLLLYIVDIFMDVAVALKYFQDKDYVWAGLTMVFILVGLVVTQIFSYAWYIDDMNDVMINPEGKEEISGMSKGVLTVIHLFGMGIFTRYDEPGDGIDKMAAVVIIRRHLLLYMYYMCLVHINMNSDSLRNVSNMHCMLIMHRQDVMECANWNNHN